MSDPVLLAPGLWCIPTTAANAYLWFAGDDDVIVVDPGLPGDEATVIDALSRLGRSAGEVSAIVLTHWHADHSGAAPALAAVSGARVLAGAPDAAVLRGETDGGPPDLTDEERPVHELIAATNPDHMAPPSCPVTTDLHDGDRLGGGRATVHLVAGHTDGSIAIHIPQLEAILTGDLVMRDPHGRIRPGLFHVDRLAAGRAVRTLADLGAAVAGFGHGGPVVGDTARALAAVTQR